MHLRTNAYILIRVVPETGDVSFRTKKNLLLKQQKIWVEPQIAKINY